MFAAALIMGRLAAGILDSAIGAVIPAILIGLAKGIINLGLFQRARR